MCSVCMHFVCIARMDHSAYCLMQMNGWMVNRHITVRKINIFHSLDHRNATCSSFLKSASLASCSSRKAFSFEISADSDWLAVVA